MKLRDKIRYLREVEGELRGLGRAMTQGELVRAIREEIDAAGGTISQSYLSQIESGTRPHLTNTSRLLLAKFFKVHPGYLVDDPDGYHAELMSDARGLEDKLDVWLVGGAERFRRDAELRRALLAVAKHDDSRGCLLLLEAILETPHLAGRLMDLLRPERLDGERLEGESARVLQPQLVVPSTRQASAGGAKRTGSSGGERSRRVARRSGLKEGEDVA